MTWSSIAAKRALHRDPRKRRVAKHQAFSQAGDFVGDGVGAVAGAATLGLMSGVKGTNLGLLGADQIAESVGFSEMAGLSKGMADGAGKFVEEGAEVGAETVLSAPGALMKGAIDTGATEGSNQLGNQSDQYDKDFLERREQIRKAVANAVKKSGEDFKSLLAKLGDAQNLAKGKSGKVGEIGAHVTSVTETINPLRQIGNIKP
jgi:hypothetical protein